MFIHPLYNMALIDFTYFQGELIVPNLVGTLGTHIATQSNLQWFINKYEVDYLNKLLGKDMAATFLTALDDNPDQKWIDLKDQIIDSVNKYSPITNYVYYFYRRSTHTNFSMSGETESKNENSQVVSPSSKITFIYNEMVDMSYEIYEWLIENKDIYPEFDIDADFYYQDVNSFNL